MRRKGLKENILTIILVLALGAAGYVWYSYLGSRPGGLVETSTGKQEGKKTSEFLALLKILEKTDIDAAFFEDSLLTGLGEKVSLPPLTSVVGRVNPFSPLR